MELPLLSVQSYIVILLLIMILTGILGGLSNYILVKHNKNSGMKSALSYALLGVFAAFLVPLFLHIIASDLLVSAQSKCIYLFVFAGFCLIFSLFISRFLEIFYVARASQKDILPLNTASQQNQIQLPEKKEEKVKEMSPVSLSKSTKNSTQSDEIPRKSLLNNKISNISGLPENALLIMRMMSEEKQTKHSLEYLYQAAGLPQHEFDEALSLLMMNGLIGQDLNDLNQLRFSLNPNGKQFLKKISCN